MRTTRRHFENLAAVYYDFVDRIPAYSWLHRVELRTVLKHSRTFHTVLDAGCATGKYESVMAKKGRRIVAIDSSISMLRIAKRRAVNADFVAGSVVHLPFRDRSFDLVVSIATMEHVPDDLERILCELSRASDDSIIFEIPNRHHPFGFDKATFERFLARDELSRYYETTAFQRLYSLYECLFAIAKARLIVQDIIYVGVISEAKVMRSYLSRLLNAILQPVAFMFKQRVREFIFVCRRPSGSDLRSI